MTTLTAEWYSTHQLFHYTKSAEVVASILQHGFVLVPNKRHLINALLPDEDFSAREPQEFGMISFTELERQDASSHREQFGQFGIGVSWDWALRHGAQRVIYIEEAGTVFSQFKWLFDLARQELKAREEPGSQAKVNKAMAAVYGAQLYPTLLTLYEFMEPFRNSSQVEWRIVNQLPVHYDLWERAKLLQKLIETAKVSPMASVRVQPNDIEMLVCPMREVQRLRAALPVEYRNVPIFPLVTPGRWQNWAAAVVAWAGELRIKRERLCYVSYEPPKGSILLPVTESGVTALPSVKQLQGIALHPDRVKDRAFVSVQYVDAQDARFELRLGVRDAFQLLGFLRQMENDPRAQEWL